jgi:hypothetical protein
MDDEQSDKVPIEVALMDILKDIKYIREKLLEFSESSNIRSLLKSRADRLMRRACVLGETISALRDRDEDFEELNVEMSDL